MSTARCVLPVLAALGLLVPVVPALAQADTEAAQRKLLSRRAAEADAYRKLAEAIKGLQITSDTYVRDFVAESDIIQGQMDEFIRGVRLGEPQWYADMSCEVPAEVTVARVVEEIKSIHTRHYKGSRIKSRDIEEIIQREERQVIRVVGMGAPRDDLPPDLPEGVVEQLRGPPPPPRPFVPPLWDQIGPRGRMMAIRAAELDAKRKLLERIKGLRITSDTLVRDFVAESDQITARASGHLLGATIVHTYLHQNEPIAEVTVEVPVETVVSIIRELHTRSIRGSRVKGTDITEVTRSIRRDTFQATGMGVPPPQVIQAYSASVEAEYPEQAFPAWATMPLEMTGHCPPPSDKVETPQGKLMAARCAELDAKRKLAEYVHGLYITSDTTVHNFIAEHDEIRTRMSAVLVGAVVSRTDFQPDGTAAVTVQLPGMQVWSVINSQLRLAHAGE